MDGEKRAGSGGWSGCAVKRRRHRHCEERSDEAIHLSLRGAMDCFASLAMTAKYDSAISRRISPELFQIRCPSEDRGRRECRVHAAPAVSCARNCAFRAHTSIQVSGNTPTSPAQWLYGLYRALPGERACCHRRRRDTSRQLSASIAAPGPHDFAVRPCSFVRAPKARLNKSVHRIPSQRLVAMANAPPRG
jgi:hypothetical protein